MRYAYGVATALLLGGTALSLAGAPVGAQAAQNAPASLAPRPGAPLSFAELAARLHPYVAPAPTPGCSPAPRGDRQEQSSSAVDPEPVSAGRVS